MVVINSVSVRKEMQKSSSLREDDLKALEEWHDRQKHLPRIQHSDFALFLFSNYYCLEATKANIENYFTVRTNLPEFFNDQDLIFSKELLKVFEKIAIIPLKKKTREEYKVILVRLIDRNLNDYIYNDALKVLIMVLDLCIYLEGTQRGYIFIFDVNGVNIHHANASNLNILKKFSEYLQKAAPIRWNGLHYINSSLTYEKIEDFVQLKIVKNQYVDAIYFHSSLNSLNEIVPQDALPNEMGGRAGPIADLQKTQIELLKNYNWWFFTMSLFGKIDSNLRPDRKCLSVVDHFGMEKELGKLEVA